MLGLEHAAIPEERREDAGEATGEGDDGHLLAAARGDAQGPGPQRLGLRRVPAKEGDRGLITRQRGREWPAVVIGPRRGVSPERHSRGTRPRSASS